MHQPEPHPKSRIVRVIPWTYTAGMLAWFALRWVYGDRLWWSALLSSFTPWFFLPLLILVPLVLLARWAPAYRLRVAVFIPVTLFCVLYGRPFLPRTPFRRPDAPILTVMTFNMWGGSLTRESAHLLAAYDYPDIVALQELTPWMVEALLAEAGTVYPYRLVSLDIPYRGQGLFSRFPMEPHSMTGPQECTTQSARISTPNGDVIVYHVHPPSSNVLVYMEDGVSVSRAVRESLALHAACIDAVLVDAQTRIEPVIVLGDLNTTDQSDAYSLLRRSLYDAHREAGWGLGHTFPAYIGSFRGIPILPRQMRIDMIFYDDSFRALTCRVGADYGESDHHPVIAELAWR
jgi:vancomycin resistance protein VanJ